MPDQDKPKIEPRTHGVHYLLTSACFSAIGIKGHPQGAGGVFLSRSQRQAARGASQRLLKTHLVGLRIRKLAFFPLCFEFIISHWFKPTIEYCALEKRGSEIPLV